MAIKYTFVGHATHILEIGGKQIVIDPFFTSNPTTDIFGRLRGGGLHF